MIVHPAFVGARGIDSEPFSRAGTFEQAQAIREAGAEFFLGYLGAMTPERLQHVLMAGLAFMPVTYANRFNGAQAVAQCMNLGLPTGCTVWLDVENVWPSKINDHVAVMTIAELVTAINSWADAITRGGYQPGGYFGSPQPLTSEELYRLRVVRYLDAMSEERDRYGQLARPKCGFCMTQVSPSRDWGGVWSDVDFIGEDFQRRLPNWVQAA
jgi:hypothetical protein